MQLTCSIRKFCLVGQVRQGLGGLLSQCILLGCLGGGGQNEMSKRWTAGGDGDILRIPTSGDKAWRLRCICL